jgi:hypothetical protein
MESFVQAMTERMSTLAGLLGAWVQAEPRTLQAQEEQVVRQVQALGTALLSGACPERVGTGTGEPSVAQSMEYPPATGATRVADMGRQHHPRPMTTRARTPYQNDA